MFSAIRRAPSTSSSPPDASTGSGSSSGLGLALDAGGLVVGLALEIGGGRLGGLHDRGHLLAGHGGQRFVRLALRLALQGLDLGGQTSQMIVDGVGLVPAAADGKIALLDALSVQWHGGSLTIGAAISASTPRGNATTTTRHATGRFPRPAPRAAAAARPH